MSYAGLRRSSRNAPSSSSSNSTSARQDAYSFANTQPSSASNHRRSMPPRPQSPPPPPPPPPQPQSSFPLLLHDADRNFILTPLTPGIPMSLRSRSQQQLDGLSAAVLMYVLHRHAALLPIRVNEINSKVLKDTARGAGRVVLKDVARRLRAIFGLRLVEADRCTATAATAATAQRAGGADGKAEGASGGRKRGRSAQTNARSAAATAATTSAADAYIVTRDVPANARARIQQAELSIDGADATTPKRLLFSWRAHSALLFTTLALCAFTYKDGIIAEERLLSLLGGLFGVGSAREMRQTTQHVVFGDVYRLITHTWVEQQYVERVPLKTDEVSEFSMYGAPPNENSGDTGQQHPHYRVGVRGRLEVGYERLYRYMVEDVMDSDVSEAGVKEMQRRDAVEQAAANVQDEKSEDDRIFEQFAFTQPVASRRSNSTISLPNEQNAQRLAPYHQAVLRYLLAHSAAPESAVLAFYRQTNPPSPRNPSLDELFTAINAATEWAALRVERVASEYADERVWLVVSRSDVDSTSVFSAYSNEEVALFRAWLQTMVTDENENGAAAMTVQDMEAVAARLDGLGKDRARRLAEGSRELAERLATHGWLYKQRKVEPQLYSIGMRSFIELLKPRVLAAAQAAAASSSSSASASAAAQGGLTLRLPECGRCRLDVYYGLYCGTQQDEHKECRQKYHYHCVQRVRQAGQIMKCRAGHTWKARTGQRHDTGEVQDRAADEEVVGSSSNSVVSRASRHSQRTGRQQERREEQEVVLVDVDEKEPESAQQVDEDSISVRSSTRRRLRRGS